MYRVNEIACQEKKCIFVHTQVTTARDHDGIFIAPLDNRKRKTIRTPSNIACVIIPGRKLLRHIATKPNIAPNTKITNIVEGPS